MEKCKHEIDMSTAKLKMSVGGWVGKCKYCGTPVVFRRIVSEGDKPYKVNKKR